MRFYYMDSMRSVLMSMGVVVHAAMVYAVAGSWVVSDPRHSVFFDGLIWLVHLFRMPAFFIIGGFFAHFLIKRSSIADFLRFRARRLGIPLLAAGILLGIPQIYLCHRFRDGHWPAPPEFITVDLPRAWMYDSWIMHLWFLAVLIVYSMITAALFAVSPALRGGARPDLRFKTPWISSPALKTALLLGTLSLYALLMGGARRLFPVALNAHLFHLLDIRETCNYAIYFAFGVFLYENAPLERSFIRLNPAHWLLLAAAGLIYFLYKDSTRLTGIAIELYAYTMLVWISVAFCFNVFIRFCNRPSPFFRYFSDASYSIYLFHHIIVIGLGMAIIPLPLPCGVKFVLLATVALALTLAIHHFLILKFDVLRLLFNGKTNRAGPRTAAARMAAFPAVAAKET